MTAQRPHAPGYFVVALVAACSADGSRSIPALGTSESALQDGRLDPEDTGVVGLSAHHDGHIVLCSGSLLAPNLVLTARHCVATPASPNIRCGDAPLGPAYPGDSVLVTEQPAFPGDPAAYTEGAETRVPPEGNDLCGFDVALVILASSLPASRAAPIDPRLDLAPQPNEPYSAVGYGATCPSDDGTCPGESGARRRVDDLRVTCALCPNPDFGTTEWLGDRALCSGDSGSPAIDEHGRVIGVASRAMQDGGACIAPVYARIDTWRTFLASTAIDAAERGGYAPPVWASSPVAAVSALTPGGGCSMGPPRESSLGGLLFTLSLALFRIASRRTRSRLRSQPYR